MNTAKFPRASPSAADGASQPETAGGLALAARRSDAAFEPAKPLTTTLFYASPAAPPAPSQPAAPVMAPPTESTHFFSVEELLGRRAPRAEPEPAPALYEEPAVGFRGTSRPSMLAALRAASPARKAILMVLPLLIGLMLARPALRRRFTPASARALPVATTPTVPSAATPPATEPQPTAPPASSVTKLNLPSGVSLSRAAADSVAAGDFARALTLYRGLAAREPHNPAHARAVSILEQRARRAAP